MVESVKRAIPGAELTNVERAVTKAEPPDVAGWIAQHEVAGLPAEHVALIRQRDGWKASAWRNRLLQLADRCEGLDPERAAELRRAAVAMTPALVEVFEERAAIMEYDGGLPRVQAEAAALMDTLAVLQDLKKCLRLSK